MKKIACIVVLLLTVVVGQIYGQGITDPTEIAIGAKFFSLGGSYAAQKGPWSLYANPAGLTSIKQPAWTSMLTKRSENSSFFVLGEVFKSSIASMGIGTTLNTAGSGWVMTTDSQGNATFSQVAFKNNALILGLADKLTDNLSWGINYKYYKRVFTGLTQEVYADGYNADLGLQFDPTKNFTLGLVYKNFMNTKLRWNNGTNEDFDKLLRVGLNYNNNRYALTSDYDLNNQTMHLGGTAKLSKLLHFNLGFDQEKVAVSSTEVGAEGNLTFGLSFMSGGITFDYCYHPYNNLSQNTTHYLSVTYELAEPVKKTDYIQFTSHKNKDRAYKKNEAIRGEADKDVSKLTANGKIVLIGKKQDFKFDTDLNFARNNFTFEAYDKDGKLLQKKNLLLVRLKSFKDVTTEYWAREAIELLATIDLISGYPDETFLPEKKIQRAEVLTNLINVNNNLNKKETVISSKLIKFKDVKHDDPLWPTVSQGLKERYIIGYPDKTFRPWRSASRAESTVMAVRFSRFTLADVLERPYQDISARHWAIKEISMAKQKDMLGFVLENFYPNADITRAEYASILAKTPKVKVKLQELFAD